MLFVLSYANRKWNESDIKKEEKEERIVPLTSRHHYVISTDIIRYQILVDF